MMWKKKSSKWAFAKCIYALPLAFIAVTAFATPEISGTLSGISSVKDIKISLPQDIKPQALPVTAQVPPPPPAPAAAIPAKQDSVFPLALLDTKPLFANGKDENEFTKWVLNNMKYPEEAKKKGIQGRVIASFELSETGQVVNAKILRGVDPELDNEVLRVLMSSPVWERPGQNMGKTVRVRYNFPVNFQLPKKEESKAPEGTK